MKFLLDENVAVSVRTALRSAGFDVKDIKEERLHGASDKEILQLANKETRIVITHDKDFAHAITAQKVEHYGVILLRFKNQKPNHVTQALINLFASEIKSKLAKNLTVLSETQVAIHKR